MNGSCAAIQNPKTPCTCCQIILLLRGAFIFISCHQNKLNWPFIQPFWNLCSISDLWSDVGMYLMYLYVKCIVPRFCKTGQAPQRLQKTRAEHSQNQILGQSRWASPHCAVLIPQAEEVWLNMDEWHRRMDWIDKTHDHSPKAALPCTPLLQVT